MTVDQSGTVVQKDDYYPFGLTFNSYTDTYPENNYKFNGKEEQKEWGVVDYGWRMYQADLGRFFAQDNYAEKYYDLNPYQYASNNPINNIDILGDSIAPGRNKGMNFFVVASKNLRQQDAEDHEPAKGPFKKLRGKLRSAYYADNLKARMKSVLSFGKLKVISADNAKDAVSKIKSKLGSKGYVKILTIDFHVGQFGDDSFSSKATKSALSELGNGYSGDATTCYLGNCWAGGNSALRKKRFDFSNIKFIGWSTYHRRSIRSEFNQLFL